MPAIQWIVQYTAPTAPMDYIHRVGRTARIGHRGSALLFVAPSEVGYLQIVSELNVRYESQMLIILHCIAVVNLEFVARSLCFVIRCSLKELKMDDVLKILTLFVRDEFEGQKKVSAHLLNQQLGCCSTLNARQEVDCFFWMLQWAPSNVQECASMVHGKFEEFVLAESAMNELARKGIIRYFACCLLWLVVSV